MRRAVFRNPWLPYALVAPQIVITVVFFFWPAFDSLRLSLYRASPFGDRLIYVGLTNFQRLFQDDASRRSVLTSFVFSFAVRSEEHTSGLQSQSNLVCRLLLE